MLKHLQRCDLDRILTTIATNYRLLVPQLLADGTKHLAPWGSGELSLDGEPLQRKPTASFFPQQEKLLTIDSAGTVKSPEPAEQPLALFGLNCFDLNGITFLDRFFNSPPADDIYLRRRTDALLIALTGYAGPQQQLLPLTAGNCDLELISSGDSWLALAHSATGQQLIVSLPDADSGLLQSLRVEGEKLISPSQGLLQSAAQLLQDDQVPDSFWAEIADRCILCTGCNLVCPTCNCFCVQDRTCTEGTTRSRVWDSCQLDAFMREASGHNPLGTEALRTRRRLHHKLVADPERWGEFGCVLCGRCDRVCPTGIGMFAVAEELVRRYERKSK